MPDRAAAESKGSDEVLRATLKKAYLARAKLFVEGIRLRGVSELIDFLSQEKSPNFEAGSLGITIAAFKKVKAAGVPPHQVFCHPDILAKKPKVIDYYRNLAALSKKGMSQVLAGLTGQARTNAQCEIINGIVSAILEEMPKVDLELARAVIPAEIGAEMQGTWVNLIGQGAAARVKELITEYATAKGMEDDNRRKEFLEELFVHQIRIAGA